MDFKFKGFSKNASMDLFNVIQALFSHEKIYFARVKYCNGGIDIRIEVEHEPIYDLLIRSGVASVYISRTDERVNVSNIGYSETEAKLRALNIELYKKKNISTVLSNAIQCIDATDEERKKCSHLSANT